MSTAKLHKHFVEAAAAHWVEAVLDGFFESGRAGDDELWGIVLVDGDGSLFVVEKPGCLRPVHQKLGALSS